jgi:putative hemolysin
MAKSFVLNKVAYLAATLIIIATLMLFLTGCASEIPSENTSNLSNTTNITKKYPPAYGAEVKYCEGLGYTYDYRLDENGTWREYCKFTSQIECEAWEFVNGNCGKEFSLCEIKGYQLKKGVEIHEGYNITFSVCLFPDKTACREMNFFNRDCHVTW